jgi:hypothetical protein
VKGNSGDGSGSDHSGNGRAATQQPTAAPTDEAKFSGSDKSRDDATPEAATSPSSEKD